MEGISSYTGNFVLYIITVAVQVHAWTLRLIKHLYLIYQKKRNKSKESYQVVLGLINSVVQRRGELEKKKKEGRTQERNIFRFFLWAHSHWLHLYSSFHLLELTFGPGWQWSPLLINLHHHSDAPLIIGWKLEQVYYFMYQVCSSIIDFSPFDFSWLCILGSWGYNFITHH